MSRLIKNVAVLMSGSVIAQLVPIALSPILARLFNENDFGEYALFTATVNIISQLVCLKYDMAIAVAKTDDEATRLFYGSVLLSIMVSLITFIAFPLAENKIWVYFLPASAFLTGLYNAVLNYNIRLSNFKDISSGNIIKSVSMVASQIILMLMGVGGASLVIGQVIAYFFGNLRLIKNIKRYLIPHKLSEILATMKENISYPIYIMWGSIAGSLVYNLTSYSLAYFYTEAQLGYYSFINRVLAVPLTMIGTSVGQAFLSEATESKKAQSEAFTFVTRALFLLSIPISVGLFLFAEPFIEIVFGESWLPCAVYLKLLLPLFVTRFVVTPISTTAIVMGKKRYTMMWQVSLLILSLVPMALAFSIKISIEEYLFWFSILLSMGYLGFYIACKIMIKKQGEKE